MRVALRVFAGCVMGFGALGIGVAGAGEAAADFEAVLTGTPHSALFGLDFDSDRGIAVGVKGAIFESRDAGKSWDRVNSPTRDALLAVTVRGGKAIAVGLAGIIATSDGGPSWTLAKSDVTQRLLGVDMNASGLAVAVGEFGTVLLSRDSGRSWQRQGPDWSVLATRENPGFAEPMMYGVAVSDSGVIMLVGEFGLIAKSDDGGQTWRILIPPRPGEPTLNALHVGAPGQNSYAVGQQGEILVSADAGETWMKCSSTTKLNFLGVSASPTGEVVVTGMRVMYRSRNNGLSWEEITSGDARSDWYQSVRVVPATSRFFAVGHSGRIVRFNQS